MLPHIPSKSLITIENSSVRVGHSQAVSVTPRTLAFELVQRKMLAGHIIVCHIHIFFFGEPWTSLADLWTRAWTRADSTAAAGLHCHRIALIEPPQFAQHKLKPANLDKLTSRPKCKRTAPDRPLMHIVQVLKRPPLSSLISLSPSTF